MRNRFTASVFACFLFAISFGISFKSTAQTIICPLNIDWELGDTTNWVGQYGGPGTIPGGVSPTPPTPPNPPNQSVITTPMIGFIPGRLDIMNSAMPNDAIGGFPVVSPLGGNFSIRIGDNQTGNGADRVIYKLTVPIGINNYSIDFLYAVVMDNPAGHTAAEKPRFAVSVTDSATGLPVKNGCYDLNFVAGDDLPGFISNGNQVYKDWTLHTLNLSGTAGKTIYIDVVTGDCTLGGHFGYAYFDVLGCKEFKVVMDSCNLDRGGAYLTGPSGYQKYEWFNNDYSILVDTGQYVAFQPITTTPQIYKLVLTPFASVSKCNDTIETVPLANINLEKHDVFCTLPNAGIPINVNPQGSNLTYTWTERNPGNTLSCNNCPAPVATTPTSNFYTVNVVDDQGCTKSEITYVGVNENTWDATDDFIFCHPGYTTLNINAQGPLPLTPVSCGSDTTPCAATEVIELQSLYRGTGYISRFDTSTLNTPFANQFSSGHLQFLLKREDLWGSGMRYGKISSIGFDVAEADSVSFDNFTIKMGCTKRSSMGGGFVPPATLTTVYTAAAPVVPFVGWNDFTLDVPYNWDTAQSIVVDICFTNPNPGKPSKIVITNTGTVDGIGAFSKAVGMNVCNGAIAAVNGIYNSRPNMRVNYCKAPSKPFEYDWTPGLYMSDSTAASPYAYISKTTYITVVGIGGSDCPLKDSLLITVPIHDYEIFPKDTSICLGQPFGLIAAGTFSGVKWYEYDSATKTFTTPTTLSCNGCGDPNTYPNPIANPTDTGMYAVEYTDKDGCNDTLYMYVTVRPLPPVKVLNPDTVLIKYGTEAKLIASGAYLYTWMPSGTLNNPNLVNPIATPKDPTLYHVYGVGENGCRNIDSVYVNIDYRANLFVPTAFTPNGDGKNDIFKVSNVTFQRLQEFKVYNRWGQEVYSTTDIKAGWDGNWRGQQQDMGVYQYVIKVAFPDGLIETYKGNVTLVR